MSLAQRVREARYSKGWGPDELASRAAISRTALYQIESGKTELPRAGTLRRIAMALDVSMETLMGLAEPATPPARVTRPNNGPGSNGGWTRGGEWYPVEGAPLAPPRVVGRYDHAENARYAVEHVPAAAAALDGDRELVAMFREVLASPFGDAVARIVEEAYRLIPQPLAASPAGATSRAL